METGGEFAANEHARDTALALDIEISRDSTMIRTRVTARKLKSGRLQLAWHDGGVMKRKLCFVMGGSLDDGQEPTFKAIMNHLQAMTNKKSIRMIYYSIVENGHDAIETKCRPEIGVAMMRVARKFAKRCRKLSDDEAQNQIRRFNQAIENLYKQDVSLMEEIAEEVLGSAEET